MLKGNIKDQSSRTVWAEYRDGFQVEIRFTPRAKLQRLIESCQRREWDSQTHQPRESLDKDKFYDLFARDVIVGWQGLTGDVLRKMVDMDSYPAEVPYSAEDAAELLRAAYDFDLWAQQVASELEFFEAAKRAAETKNS